MKAITTQYDHTKRRYRAWDQDRNMVVVPAPVSDILEAGVPRGHRLAALELIRKMGWGPCGIQSGSLDAGQYVHVMLPTFEKPFPRFFRHVARPTSDAVFVRWDSKQTAVAVTKTGAWRRPAVAFDWFDMITIVDMGLAFEITEQDAAAMLLEVAAGGNPWREP